MSKRSDSNLRKELNDLLAMTKQHACCTIDDLITKLRQLKQAFRKPQDGPPIDWEAHVRLLRFLQQRVTNFEQVVEMIDALKAEEA